MLITKCIVHLITTKDAFEYLSKSFVSGTSRDENKWWQIEAEK